MNKLLLAVVLAATVGVGVQAKHSKKKSVVLGGLSGGGLGAIIGGAAAGGKGAAIGGPVGFAAGAGIGALVNRRRERRQG